MKHFFTKNLLAIFAIAILVPATASAHCCTPVQTTYTVECNNTNVDIDIHALKHEAYKLWTEYVCSGCNTEKYTAWKTAYTAYVGAVWAKIWKQHRDYYQKLYDLCPNWLLKCKIDYYDRLYNKSVNDICQVFPGG